MRIITGRSAWADKQAEVFREQSAAADVVRERRSCTSCLRSKSRWAR
jgi:hypothetical protein